jgi:hypothetical protein
VHPLMLEELAGARIEELRREAVRERRALELQRPSPTAEAARRSLRAFGFLLVRAGLRLATAGEGGRGAGGSVA